MKDYHFCKYTEVRKFAKESNSIKQTLHWQGDHCFLNKHGYKAVARILIPVVLDGILVYLPETIRVRVSFDDMDMRPDGTTINVAVWNEIIRSLCSEICEMYSNKFIRKVCYHKANVCYGADKTICTGHVNVKIANNMIGIPI